MGDLAKNIFEKLSSYQLFNFFYPGAIFIFLLKYSGFNFVDELPVGFLLLISHFLGLTFSRIGSLVIEDLMIKIELIHKLNYENYVKAEKVDSKVQLLLEITNMYRTLSAMFLVQTIVVLVIRFLHINNMSSHCCLALVYFLLFVLFALAFKKQYKYIEERVDANNRIDINS